MNNSRLAIEHVSLTLEEPVDRTTDLTTEEAKLVQIIGALNTITQTKEWSTLKTAVFDPLVGTLEKELTIEGKKEAPDTLKLNRLAGQLKWAEKYADLDKLTQIFREQLTNIRKKLHG